MKPNFMVIGAAKCGTTSFCYLLRQHPDIFMPEIKETGFFSNDDVYARGWDWYESLFEDGENKIAIGEGSTNYSKKIVYPNSIKRIVKHLPNLKLIYIVRNPIEQIRSLWSFNYLMGNDDLPFDQAIKKHSNYLDNANYLRQIDVYRNHYSDDNIQILFFEDFIKNPQKVMEKTFRFLEVDHLFMPRDTEKPQNITANKYGDRKFLKILKQTSVYSHIAKILTPDLKERIRPCFKWRMKSPPVWNDVIRDWVISQIKTNTEEFLERYEKPKDFWRLD